jgi:hypothetical protein
MKQIVNEVDAASYWCPILRCGCLGAKCMKWDTGNPSITFEHVAIFKNLDGGERTVVTERLMSTGSCGY